MSIRGMVTKRRAGIALAGFLCVGLLSYLASSPRALQAADKRDAQPLSPEMAAAIRNGDEPAIRKLLDKGADVNARDAEGNTPLILAALYARPEVVAHLLKHGADVNAANKAGATALVRAATSYEKTRLLLAAGAKAQVRTEGLGNTPLLLAARRAGNARTVRLLLAQGADADEANTLGVTPIMAAAASGDLESVKLLLGKGANPNTFPEARSPNDGLAAGLRTPLMWAAYHDDIPMLSLLLDRGADANQVIPFGTALVHAAWHDSLGTAKLLVARGAKVDLRDPFANFTALLWAAGTESPHAELVQFLLDSGADPNDVGGEPVGALGLVPQTPLLIAQKRGDTAIVRTLLAAGAKAEPRPQKLELPQRRLAKTPDEPARTSATEKALAALQTTAARSREAYLQHVSHQDCTSCHQQYLPMAAVGHARGRSVRFDHDAAQEQLDLAAKLRHPFFDPEFIGQTVFHPDPAYTYGYEAFGWLAEKVPPSPATDMRVHHLLTVQAADGRWYNNIPRPPIQSSDVGATALAVQAIKRYGWPAARAEIGEAVDRARAWLWKVEAETNEEAVFQLLGLHWSGEPAEKLAGLATELLKRQRTDGGWAQLPTLESDAYATGEALFALAQAVNQPATSASYERGLRFLLQTQHDDGTWHVARRTFPFQPTIQSGFPYHRDGWLSAAATSWAVLALTESLPAGSAPEQQLKQEAKALAQAPAAVQKVNFAEQVKPLLERSCVGCHSGERPRGFLRVDVREALLRGGESGMAAVVPGHSDESLLVDYVSGQVLESEMPPKAKRDQFPALSRDEVALLRAWIDQGAAWPQDVTLRPVKLR